MVSYTKVRNYKSKELIDRVKNLKSFKYIPKRYWILGVRSNEDSFNIFDDKFYIFKGEKFVSVMTGTTNSGEYGLFNYKKWNKKGVAVIKSDEWYYSVWQRGWHKGKIQALIQIGKFKVIRDGNYNKKSGDTINWEWEENNGLNFHPSSYKFVDRIKKFIGKWSTGCQVVNNIKKYYEFINYSKPQKKFTYVLIDEF